MSRPLKLLILGRDPDMFARPGGAPNDTRERHIAYARELQRRRPGSEMRIVVHTFRPGGGRYEEPIPGLRLYGTYSRRRWQCPFDLANRLRAFRREGWIADLVSCQTGYEEGLIALATADPRSRIEIQMHGDFYGSAFATGGALRAVQQRILRATIKRSDHVRAVSHGIRDSILRSGDMPEERISVAPVPISFVPAACAPGPVTPTVLFVGRLFPEKDLDLWCDVAQLIRKRIPEARFVVAGDGPERARLADRAPALGGALELPGNVAYGDLAALYARASVFLLTSEYEGLGRVVVEAMLAGLPVVSTATLGPRELIQDGATGRIVPAREPAGLAEAVIELLESPARAMAMGRAGRAWAERNFGFDALASRLIDSWERAAELPKRAS